MEGGKELPFPSAAKRWFCLSPPSYAEKTEVGKQEGEAEGFSCCCFCCVWNGGVGSNSCKSSSFYFLCTPWKGVIKTGECVAFFHGTCRYTDKKKEKQKYFFVHVLEGKGYVLPFCFWENKTCSIPHATKLAPSPQDLSLCVPLGHSSPIPSLNPPPPYLQHSPSSSSAIFQHISLLIPLRTFHGTLSKNEGGGWSSAIRKHHIPYFEKNKRGRRRMLSPCRT